MELQLYGKKIWLYRKAIDFRRSIDGLSYVIQSELKKELREGIYLFFNRRGDKIKGLSWHKNGFILFYKRLERGCFHITVNKERDAIEIQLNEFQWLLAGLEWQKMKAWGELNYDKFS